MTTEDFIFIKIRKIKLKNLNCKQSKLNQVFWFLFPLCKPLFDCFHSAEQDVWFDQRGLLEKQSCKRKHRFPDWRGKEAVSIGRRNYEQTCLELFGTLKTIWRENLEKSTEVSRKRPKASRENFVIESDAEIQEESVVHYGKKWAFTKIPLKLHEKSDSWFS